ncbi:hypothetical protein NQ176_g7245 [Zarea fungicola]|uniref:Uncharacterized protein n=1 Tax=Zarea fungicola TaxID=93591 RepID=A0ACC1MZK8_9HYPO|nr:hypothetical protein NQ176_g7245 [Lecanicillium fungicola]
MTDPVSILPQLTAGTTSRPTSSGSIINTNRETGEWRSSFLTSTETDASRPISTFSYNDTGAQYDEYMHEKIAQFPVPPNATLRDLVYSSIQAQFIEPREAVVVPPALRMSNIMAQGFEPIASPRPPMPVMSLGQIQSEAVEPIEPPVRPTPTMSLGQIQSEAVEPVEAPTRPMPVMSLGQIQSQALEPIESPKPDLPVMSLGQIKSEAVEPIAPPTRPVAVMSLGQIQSQAVEPIEPPAPTGPKAVPMPLAIPALVPKLSMSSIDTQHIAPTALPELVLGYSTIVSERVSPVSEPLPALPALGFSSVMTEQTAPVSPAKPAVAQLSLSTISSETIMPRTTPKNLPMLTFSEIQYVDIEPQSPRNDRRNGFILPRDFNSPEKSAPETPNNKVFGALFGRGKHGEASPTIAEDETRQSLSDSPNPETPESQRPFKEISANSFMRPPRKSSLHKTNDQGAQTSLTGGAIDRMVHTTPKQATRSSNDALRLPDRKHAAIRTRCRDRFAHCALNSTLEPVKKVDGILNSPEGVCVWFAQLKSA